MSEMGQSTKLDTLVVDLDGTLIRTDMLHESVFGLLHISPFYLFVLPFWLLRGKAHLKQMIADRVEIRIDLLPWHAEFLLWLKEEKRNGTRLILATASNWRYAEGIAKHLGIFSGVLASTAQENLSGSAKLAGIQKYLQGDAFAYAGNAAIDLTIWSHSDAAILVDPKPGIADKAAQLCRVERVFESPSRTVYNLLRAMRPHQWLKNFLVYAPLVLSHNLGNFDLFLQATLAFLAFCLCASSVYLLNDLLDLESDRQHPRKRHRPFAAGDLSAVSGVLMMLVLLVASAGIASLLPPYFLPVLVIYYAFTMAYSLWLKRAALVDALVLAGLYTLRLIAGAAAISVAPTFWLLAFSIFIFMSLALIKRYSELLLLSGNIPYKVAGRGYRAVDMETLAQLGTASGYLAVLVLALYINGDTVSDLYARPEALWLLCPMMLYWVSRMWLLTRRGDMHDDPVVFTIRDMRTWWLAALATVSLLVATFWPVIRPFLPLPV